DVGTWAGLATPERLHNPVTPAYKLAANAARRHLSRGGSVVLNAHVSQTGWPALVLNADFRPLSYYPLSLWSWQDAIKAVFLERVNIVAQYDRAVRSPSLEMKLPSVVSLKTFVKPATQPAFTRFNVFLRDKFSCQYCALAVQGFALPGTPLKALSRRRRHDYTSSNFRHQLSGEAPWTSSPTAAGASQSKSSTPPGCSPTPASRRNSASSTIS